MAIPRQVGKSLENYDSLAIDRLLIWMIRTRTMMIEIVMPIQIPIITDSGWVFLRFVFFFGL